MDVAFRLKLQSRAIAVVEFKICRAFCDEANIFQRITALILRVEILKPGSRNSPVVCIFLRYKIFVL